jgi:hypothetical protein
MRYLIAVALLLVSTAAPAYARGSGTSHGTVASAHARGTRHGTITSQSLGSAIVPPLAGTIVPPFTGPVREVRSKIITISSNGTIVEKRLATRRSRGFGVGDFGSFGDFGGFGDVGSPALVSEAPPSVDFIEPRPAPSRSLAELPPCRETTSFGVVIERGIACSRVAQGVAN